MTYLIGEEAFANKAAITVRCRQILYAAHQVGDEDVAFLLHLFQHHEEWPEKSHGGVEGVRVYKVAQGTACFHLVCGDGRIEDISFGHSIKCVPSSRSAARMPQTLIDYKNAARETIKPQTRAFRDTALLGFDTCPVTGETLTETNVHVDHLAPLTFDRLLRDFTAQRGVDPNGVEVGSQGGTVPFFVDRDLAEAWADYHRTHAVLRLTSQQGNLRLPKERVDW